MLLAISIFLAACTAAMIGAGFTRNRVPVAVSVVIAAALRITFALMTSQQYTPKDTRVYFRTTGELERFADPTTRSPSRAFTAVSTRGQASITKPDPQNTLPPAEQSGKLSRAAGIEGPRRRLGAAS